MIDTKNPKMTPLNTTASFDELLEKAIKKVEEMNEAQKKFVFYLKAGKNEFYVGRAKLKTNLLRKAFHLPPKKDEYEGKYGLYLRENSYCFTEFYYYGAWSDATAPLITQVENKEEAEKAEEIFKELLSVL